MIKWDLTLGLPVPSRTCKFFITLALSWEEASMKKKLSEEEEIYLTLLHLSGLQPLSPAYLSSQKHLACRCTQQNVTSDGP